ncbi:MAG: acyltransferase [Limnobacter sp.]|nr:acyltransferase [Limnobacter sp.]
MLSFLPPSVRGVLASTLLVLNTLFWCLLLFPLALVKLLLPLRPVRAAIDPIANAIAVGWISGNSAWMRLTQDTQWDVSGLDGLENRGWYLVSANHQSWVDIFVLQRVLNGRTPLLKFFLKQELIWVPVIGLAWWALDFPFMRRHSDAYVRRHPEKRFDDLEATRRACEKFALVPTSVMNFPEGTRFTEAKRIEQKSPYRNLLKPRAGAMALAMNVLGERFRALLDVTIVYPGGIPSFWDFLCGRVTKIIVRIRPVEIPAELATGDYATDSRFRKTIQRWLIAMWKDKDREIDALLGRPSPQPAAAAAVDAMPTTSGDGDAD